DFEEIPEEYLQ
nr:Chain I, Hirudin Iiia [Hirudo medicinalis]1DWC_I Chain I, Hirudin Iiia [Hirudo medicinalis]1DWD_I Chain I, Hirudin Iiia [Hirudo medicinalis]1DWE_I Chain I, Hirudin Iiia [Hirudo medicinalis]1VZQ_I Chain I, HIRUDIN VARIANT-2 [Hirudo medicinalis]2R2M_H Chain H, Hirudin-3A [Hirudo medicinalis]3C27_H Chain H, Hirudin-3A [Hirudo medicinalis]3LDX_I Chain I, Hirudin variant-1 [Hirudo medicinalis]4AX9_I Chain I, Hirudin Variant-1 [Hirudo medicinalis]4AYV_D Chain D, Hirudin-3a' [Hirudo medicinali